MFCLYNLIAFANSKDDSPIYRIYVYYCIFTSYYLYIIIYHQQTCLPNSKAYPKKRRRQVLHGPYTGPIPSLGEYFPSPVPSIEDTTPEPKKRRLQSKTEKPCPEPPMVWLAKKNPEQKWKMVWNVSTTTIRLGWFQIFCFECSTRSTFGK